MGTGMVYYSSTYIFIRLGFKISTHTDIPSEWNRYGYAYRFCVGLGTGMGTGKGQALEHLVK